MRKQPKILVVEDNFTTRTLIEHVLDLEGYDVVSVADGGSAMRRIEAEIPTLVILDVMLPGADGFTVLSHIRDNEATRELPVLLLTALDDAESTWKGWTGGCNYYMSKPFDTEDLVSVVGTLTTGEAA